MQKKTRTKRHRDSNQTSKTTQEETPVLMDRSSLHIDEADIILLQAFHPSPYVRQAASELHWTILMYNRFKVRKNDAAKHKPHPGKN